jgi:hypothetical protein
MALPSNVGTGTVTGTFLRGVIDSTDPDREPEGIPVVDLTATFTPAVSVITDGTSTPPVTVFPDTVVCGVNASGSLVGPDMVPGVKLIATTDTAISPLNWTWTVTLKSPTLGPFSYAFMLPAGQIVDLATVLQVPESKGQPNTSIPPAVYDNGDGTSTVNGFTLTDNGDGTFTLAA